MNINALYHLVYNNTDISFITISLCLSIVLLICIEFAYRECETKPDSLQVIFSIIIIIIGVGVIIGSGTSAGAPYTSEYRQGYNDYPNSETYSELNDLIIQVSPRDIPLDIYLYRRGWEAARHVDSVNKLKNVNI